MIKIKRLFCVILIEALVFMGLSSFCYPASIADAATNQEKTAQEETKKIITTTMEELLKEITARAKKAKAEAEAKAKAEAEAQAKAEAEARVQEEAEAQSQWNGEVLTAWGGVANGPSGLETYYNLPMEGVVSIMRNLGYDEENYPYWVRDDGCKMLGDYIMVAANLEIRPEGTILPTSLGMGIVCDTGTFAQSNPYQLDIAVNW